MENTFNGYQEMKQLEKRMAEYAAWSGDYMQEALQDALSKPAATTSEAFTRAVRELDMKTKGQMTTRAHLSLVIDYAALSAYKAELRRKAKVV